MRKKNILEYIVLALFIMCMALALSATLEYVTRATNREYLNQASYLFMVLCVSIGLLLLVRVTQKAGEKMYGQIQRPVKRKMWCYFIILGLFWLIGLALRIIVIEGIPIQPSSDFETYYRIAIYLMDDKLLTPVGESYREYIALYPHTIGFPMMILLPVFKLFGASVKNALYTNLVFSMLSVLLTARIARRCAGRTAGLIAGFAMALWPSHIFYSNMVATEPAFTFFILLATELAASVTKTGKYCLYNSSPVRLALKYMVIGVVLAIAGAIRPMAIILLAALAVARILQGNKAWEDIRKSTLQKYLSNTVCCLLLLIIPYLLTGQVITRAISEIIMETPAGGLNASGYNLMVGVNTESGGLWNQEDADFFREAYERTGTANDAHAECMQEALRRIRQEPEDVLNLLVYKFRDLWGNDDFGIDWNLLWAGQQGILTQELTEKLETARPWGRGAYMCVLFFALLSALDMWRKKRAPAPISMLCILFFLGTALSHMLLETQVRYHYNMIPYLIILSSMTIAGWRKSMLDEPPVKVVIRYVEAEEELKRIEPKDNKNEAVDVKREAAQPHSNFDIMQALREGHVQMTISQGYENLDSKKPDDEKKPINNPDNLKESVKGPILETEEHEKK